MKDPLDETALSRPFRQLPPHTLRAGALDLLEDGQPLSCSWTSQRGRPAIITLTI